VVGERRRGFGRAAALEDQRDSAAGVRPANGHRDREEFLPLVEDFLQKNFHLAPNRTKRRRDDYPPLPLLLSLLDIAIDRRQSLGREWPTDRLEKVRNALEYIIFAVLTHELSEIENPNIANKSNHYLRFLQTLPTFDELYIISLHSTSSSTMR
jgi:hypothetical protein